MRYPLPVRFSPCSRHLPCKNPHPPDHVSKRFTREIPLSRSMARNSVAVKRRVACVGSCNLVGRTYHASQTGGPPVLSWLALFRHLCCGVARVPLPLHRHSFCWPMLRDHKYKHLYRGRHNTPYHGMSMGPGAGSVPLRATVPHMHTYAVYTIRVKPWFVTRSTSSTAAPHRTTVLRRTT